MGRLVAILIVLAALAVAETRRGDQTPTLEPYSNAASCQLADSPVPAPDVPAIITAAGSTSATAQTLLVVESRRQLRPALSVSTVSLRLPVVVDSTDKPRVIPLLI